MAELFVTSGVCGGTAFVLPDVPTVLGRSPESHVQVTDPWISSMHALFERRGDQLWVVDLDSRNGTFVDEERVHEAPVGPGSKLRFGRTSAELRPRPEDPELRDALADQRTIFRYLSDLAGAPLPSLPDDLPPTVSEPSGEIGGATHAAITSPVARRQIAVLNEIGRALLGSVELADSLRRLLRVLAGALGAERSGVLLVDDRGAMEPLVAEPPDGAPHLSTTVLDAMLRNRAGILTRDAQRDTRFARSESVIAHGIQSCIGAPIWSGDRIFGVLLLERAFTSPFTAEDLELATVVGFQAALALERVRLAERERAAAELRGRLLRHLDAGSTAAIIAAAAGAPSGRAQLEPEVRDDVAVLAAAPAGLPELAAVRPAAEAAARALGLQRMIAEAAQAEGAAVDLRVDGGVLAVFDLPLARRDALARARRCALSLLERTAALEGERDPPRLSVRVGIATGRALLGNFGPGDRPELRAMGEAVDEALRRAAEAAPGEALLDEPGGQLAPRHVRE